MFKLKKPLVLVACLLPLASANAALAPIKIEADTLSQSTVLFSVSQLSTDAEPQLESAIQVAHGKHRYRKHGHYHKKRRYYKKRRHCPHGYHRHKSRNHCHKHVSRSSGHVSGSNSDLIRIIGTGAVLYGIYKHLKD